MVKVYINNQEVQVPEGTLVLDAAKKAGVKIPTLCHMPDTEPKGACRVCLVEVEGARSLAASCSMPVFEGMKVFTNNKHVREARRTVVELLLSEHDGECTTCDRNDDCELQTIAREMGITSKREIKSSSCRRSSPLTLAYNSSTVMAEIMISSE